MIRIVKMTYDPSHCDDFLKHFEVIKEHIIAMPGCNELRLHRDLENPCIFFTYSHWENDEALQHYRKSELFTKTWTLVKSWFSEKAMAWSVDTIFEGR
jgi:quinol monooxygenase YgiN